MCLELFILSSADVYWGIKEESHAPHFFISGNFINNLYSSLRWQLGSSIFCTNAKISNQVEKIIEQDLGWNLFTLVWFCSPWWHSCFMYIFWVGSVPFTWGTKNLFATKVICLLITTKCDIWDSRVHPRGTDCSFWENFSHNLTARFLYSYLELLWLQCIMQIVQVMKSLENDHAIFV